MGVAHAWRDGERKKGDQKFPAVPHAVPMMATSGREVKMGTNALPQSVSLGAQFEHEAIFDECVLFFSAGSAQN